MACKATDNELTIIHRIRPNVRVYDRDCKIIQIIGKIACFRALANTVMRVMRQLPGIQAIASRRTPLPVPKMHNDPRKSWQRSSTNGPLKML